MEPNGPRRVTTRTRVLLLAIALGVALMAFSIQIVDQEHGPDPVHKVFLASWLSSQLWVDPWLMVLGVVTVSVALTLLALGLLRAPRGR